MKKVLISWLAICIFLTPIEKANSEELLSYKGISASTNNDFQCQSETSVRLEASDENQYRQSRVDMQALSDMVKTYLWLDCPNIESVNFEGYVTGQQKSVYQASASKRNSWHLSSKNDKEKIAKSNKSNSSAKDQTKKEHLARSTSSKSQTNKEEKFDSQKALEQGASKGSDEAAIELAKGLLALESANKKIEFKQDKSRGIKLLEELALEGNLDAKHLLGEAYRVNPRLPINIPLLKRIMRSMFSVNNGTRGQLAASMTIESARDGGKAAIKALKNAGKAGSSRSFYALATMYLLNTQNNMPMDAEFLQGELDMKVKNRRGKKSSSVDVGMHFMKLAAENGNANAQKTLKEMDVEYTSNASQNSQNSQSASARQLAKGIDELEKKEMGNALQQEPISGKGSTKIAEKPAGAQNGSGQGQAAGAGEPQTGKKNGKGSKQIASNSTVKNKEAPKSNEIEGAQKSEKKEEEIID